MIQTRPYEFMVKYTAQKEWIEGRGVLIAFAFFLGGISGGLYLVSLYFNSLPGMFLSWLIALLMGILDMAHLSKPQRFWRMALKPQTSWIARGFIFIVLFIGFVAIQLALAFWLPGTIGGTMFKILAGVTAFAVAIYPGFVVSYVSAIRFWNSAIIPILFVISGVTGGLALMLAISLSDRSAQITVLANMLMVILVVHALILAVYVWSSTYAGSVARDAVMWLIRGSLAPVFWVGVVLFGIIIPLAILFATQLAGSTSAVWLLTAVAGAIIGCLALRFVVLKAGIYRPLVPASSSTG